MITTTLNRIRWHNPCVEGWTKLLSHLSKTKADDEPLPYSTIIDAVGLQDTLWCLRAEPQYDREWRLFAVWCARQVQHLMTDPRSIAAIDVAERHAHGEATDEELRVAREAAWAAAEAAARDAEAAWATAAAAAWASSREAAWAAAAAPGSAALAAYVVADDARVVRVVARAAGAFWAAEASAVLAEARAAQDAELRRIVG
jgi:hypothetical protein